jgi:hypothetical protein
MDKFSSMNLIKQDSIDSIKSQVSQYLSNSGLQSDDKDIQEIIQSLETVIDQVIAVKSQLYSVSEVSTLDTKKEALDSMIRGVCFSDVNPVVNYTRNDDRDENIVDGRTYFGYDDDFVLYEDTGVNLTAALFKDYVIGGWVRWLDFIDYTYDHEEEETVIFRLTSEYDEDIEEDVKFADRHAILYATSSYYRVCTHDTQTNNMNLCYTFNFSGHTHENSWQFFMFMYSYNTQVALARVRIDGAWTTYDFPTPVVQTPTSGVISFYLGHDAFYDMGTTGFNGELTGWNVWYGVNSWQSKPGMWDDSQAESICNKYFRGPVDVPYVEILLNPNTVIQNQVGDETSLYSFYNTFFEAQDYGFGLWVKLDSARGFNPDDRQIVIYSFEQRTDITTPGNNICEVFTRAGSLWVKATYERDNQIVSTEQELAALYQDDWFFVQVHFSTTDQIIKAWFQQSNAANSIEFDDVDRILIPANVFFTTGFSTVLNTTGADFTYKGIWVYAGVQTLYGQPCDPSCKSCNGPNANDCIDCNDGAFLNESNVCQACADDCLTCGGCGTGECTACKPGKVLVNGDCYCDPSCQTCSGMTNQDCLTCALASQFLVNGKCVTCDSSCAACSDSGPNACTQCFAGFEVSADGSCVPVCDTTKCKSCTSDGSKCAECNSPQVLYDGDCVDCDQSCNTCSGPLDYQCLDCVAQAQFVDGKCIICDASCLTCDGPNPDDCLTCSAGLVLEGCQCLVPCDLDNGNFRDGNNSCVPCNADCLTCKDLNGCTSCDSDHVLLNDQCVLPPSPPVTCDTDNNYVLIKGQCILCDIDNGFALINDDCITCDPSCLTCDGPNDDNCLTCVNPDYTVSNGICQSEHPICDPNNGWLSAPDDNGNCVPCTTNCTSCVDPNVLNDNNECVPPPPPPPPCDTDNGYVVLPDGTCGPCDDTCATCSGVSSNNCLSCDNGTVLNNLTGTCDVPCDVDNGFVLSNGQCLPCDVSCNTCNGPSYLDCIDCATGLSMVAGVCLPPCDTDNGFVLKGRQCLPCDSSCLTCKDTSNADCTSCVDGLNLQAGSCVVIPPECNKTGFVFINNLCVPCDPSCLNCDDIGNKDCTECFDDLILVAGSCIVQPVNCDLNNGQIIINDVCYNCSDTCLTCNGVEDSDCIECADGLVMEAGYCVVPCDVDNGFYLSNGACLPCNKVCATCHGSNPQDCDTCIAGFFQDIDGKCFNESCVDQDYTFQEKRNGVCTTDCDCDGTRRCSPYGECHDCLYLATTFPNNYTDAVCPVCHPTCVTCRGARSNDCWSCLQHEFLSNGTCFPCDDSCSTCNGTTESDCTSCDETDMLIAGNCIVPCDVNNGNFYYDNQNCLPCDPSCKTCHNETAQDCDTCNDGYNLTADGECLVPCDTSNGYYYDNNSECQKCDDTCKTCDSENCTECFTADFFENGKCKPSDCVSYDYKFNESNIDECNSDCECDGTRRCDQNGECQDCNTLIKEFPDLYTADVCPPCHYSCATCRGPAETDCDTCPSGSYFDSGECLPCDSSCSNCTGPSNSECTVCDSAHVLMGGKCVQPCDINNGYFYNSDEVCTECDSTCQTCHNTDRDGCDSCYGTYTLEGSICKPPCALDSGYTYDDQFNCVPCTSPCSVCTAVGDDQCTDCDKGYTLSDGHCVDCVSFYYDFDEFDNPNGPSQCSSDCECDNTRRCGPDGVCQNCVTLAQEWPDLYDINDCPPCNPDCLTCNGPLSTNCTACQNGEYLGSDGGCYACDDTCLTCDGPGSDECSSCNNGTFLQNGECIVPPPPPIPCDSTCLECDGPTNYNCTKCGDDFELTDDGECVPLDCVTWDYNFDELTSGLGPHRCDDDCECDGTRRCSPDKYCAECLDLVSLYPNLYDLKDCPPCDASCQTCFGPDADSCNSCSNGNYLTSSNSCNQCDDNCALCSGTATNCTGCQSDLVLNDDNECVIPCDPTCLTCSGPAQDECLTCTDDKTLENGTCIVTQVCVKLNYTHDESTNILGPSRCINDCDCDSSRRCSPEGYCRECMYLAVLYPNNYDMADCPPCDDTCLTCQGPSANDCTMCPDGSVLVGGKCEPCDSTCKTCNDVDAQHCTACPDDKVLSSGACVDPPIVCDKTCLDCDGPNPWECTDCPDNLVFNEGYCEQQNCVSWNYTYTEVDGRCDTDCDCDGARRCSPDKYCQECDDLAFEFPSIYPPSDCPACDKSCETCDGPTDTDCTSCDNGFALVNGACVPCDTSCATCSGTTDNDCTSCPQGFILDGGKCVVPPPVCDPTCWTCSGTGPNDCTSCPQGYQLEWDSSCQLIENCVKWGYSHDESTNPLGPNKCYNDCDCDGTRRCSPTGLCRECADLANAYPSQYNIADCPVCDKSCLTCDGPSDSDCTACADSFVLIDGSCSICDSPCLTCSNDTDSCTSCEDGYVLNGTSCVEPPIECDVTCLECDGPASNQCTACPDDKVLQSGSCVPVDCVAFDYVYNENDSPLGPNRCNDDCECDGTRRCSPDKYCAECFDLVSEFPTVYAFSDCPVCEQPCQSCNGPTNQDCTSCGDGFVLVNGSCDPCDPTCVTCQDTTSTGCIVCPVGYDLELDGSCVIHIDCDKNCPTCNGPNYDQCTSCDDTRVLVNGQCILQCVSYDYSVEENSNGSCTSDCDCDGTRRCSPSDICEDCSYLDNLYPSLYDQTDCPPCDKSCDSCTGPSDKDCKSCVDGEYLADDGSCQLCDKSCNTCDGPDTNQCTSCNGDQILNDGNCVTPNPVCDTTCATCNDVGPYNCTSCADEYVLQDDGSCAPENCIAWNFQVNELLNTDGPHKCDDDCQCDGTRVCLPIGICADCLDAVEELPSLYDVSMCPPCHESCQRCSGPTYLDCTACEDDEVLLNNQCFPCDVSCETCFETSPDGCSSCPTGEELNSNNQCVTPPPVCDTSCATCFGPTANNCSSCSNGTVLVNSTCMDPADCDYFAYYHDENHNVPAPGRCTSDCDCSSTRQCSPTGYCHECLWLAEKYPTQFNAADCPPCDPSCATCNGPYVDNCLSCPDGTYLSDDNTCNPCDKTCQTCYGPDSDSCLSCVDPNILHNGFCDTPNPVCDPTCLTCNGTLPTNCVTCSDEAQLTAQGTCEQINCVDFNYVHNETLNIEGPHECKDDCDCDGARRCSPSGYCEDCLVLAEEYPSTYLASDCPKCDPSCVLCDGPTDRNCTQCLDSVSFFNGQCIDCDESCLTCYGTDSDNCLSCPPGQVLFEYQCFTPNSTCDPSCVTCSGPSANECTSCPCDSSLTNGQCVSNVIVCDDSCLTCWGTASNQCRTCDTGKVLLAGECVTVSSFFGVRSHEDQPISYEVANKFTTGSDIGLGSWAKFRNFVPKVGHKYNLLFRLSGMTGEDKAAGNNRYRFSTLAVYYNTTHYTFETYSKISGTPTLLQKSIPLRKVDMDNKWNLVFFGYSRKHAAATGFVKLADGTTYEVNFKNIYQDLPKEKMEVFFYGDHVYNGYNGEVSSPEVLHGNNFLQGFSEANHETYFKLAKKN